LTVAWTMQYCPWTGSIKPSLQHFQFCSFEHSLGILFITVLQILFSVSTSCPQIFKMAYYLMACGPIWPPFSSVRNLDLNPLRPSDYQIGIFTCPKDISLAQFICSKQLFIVSLKIQ
jgi:hypothetical protein